MSRPVQFYAPGGPGMIARIERLERELAIVREQLDQVRALLTVVEPAFPGDRLTTE